MTIKNNTKAFHITQENGQTTVTFDSPFTWDEEQIAEVKKFLADFYYDAFEKQVFIHKEMVKDDFAFK